MNESAAKEMKEKFTQEISLLKEGQSAAKETNEKLTQEIASVRAGRLESISRQGNKREAEPRDHSHGSR